MSQENKKITTILNKENMRKNKKDKNKNKDLSAPQSLPRRKYTIQFYLISNYATQVTRPIEISHVQ